MPIITRIRQLFKLDKRPKHYNDQLLNEPGFSITPSKYLTPPPAEIRPGIAGGGCLVNSNNDSTPIHHTHIDTVPVMHHAGH